MPAVTLVDPRGNVTTVSTIRELDAYVVHGSWVPQSGTIADAYTVFGAPAPATSGGGGNFSSAELTELRAALGSSQLPQFHGVRYTAYGHSFGQVQAPPNVWAGSVYPARLRDLLRADPGLYVNRTVSGNTMTQIAAAAASNWVDGNGGLVTLMGNQNSVGKRESETAFKAAVRSFLSTVLGSTGKPPTVLVIKDTTCTSVGYARYTPAPTDADVARYNGYLTDVIAEFPSGWIITADPMADGWDPATMTCPDGQHPNDHGMAHIVASCMRALAAANYRPGLNLGVTGPAINAPVTAPTALTLSATAGDGQVTLSATGGTGTGVTYAIYRGTTATGTPIATAFPFTDTGRANGTGVSYVATATNSAGTVTSNVATATPTAAVTAPTALTITATPGNAQVTIAASGATGATSFALYRGTTATGTPIATSLPFTDTGLTNGTEVSYIATATNSAGSVTSNIASATPTNAPVAIASDDFARADTTAGLGATPIGAKTWTYSGLQSDSSTPTTTVVWGITNGQAYAPASTVESKALIDAGTADCTITATAVVIGDGGLVFRWGSETAYWIAYATAAGQPWKLMRRNGASYVTAATSTVNAANGQTVQVILSGTAVALKVNGTAAVSTTDSVTTINTRHGLRAGVASANVGTTATARWDDFSVTTP